MKPTFEFREEMVDNAGAFTDPFFRRFTLRPMPKPLALNEKVTRAYQFPTFLNQVTCAIGIFMCSYAKAEKMMLHPEIKPVKMTKGRALVIFSCYEYKQVMGMPPYNEIACSIPVMVAPKINLPVLPVLPMLAPIFPSLGYYVVHMPVTSLENQLRGRKIWGLPKVVQEIDIRFGDGECVTRAFEESGEQYFELTVPTTGAPAVFDVASNLYSELDGRLLQARTGFKGTFTLHKYLNLLFAKGVKLAKPFLKLGNTPSARLLLNLELEENPFQFRFCPNMMSFLDLPSEDYQPQFALRR